SAYGVEAKASLEGATVKYWNEETEAYDLDESPAFTDWIDGPKTVKFQATLYGYEAAEGEATVTINKKDVTISVADSSKVYGADDPAFEKATITEYVGEDLD
ncbi:hypothetical protein, partial [Collinsella intestinalis]|uniref:hypothetical protein n=1 Tax=Collinsella intestinalis TaxID=147207 RepID=UPI00195DDD5C